MRLPCAARHATRVRDLRSRIRVGGNPSHMPEGNVMFKLLLRWTTIALVVLPIAAAAEPIKLKLAFFSSDRTVLYRAGIKPFVDAVNADGKGVVEIDVHFSGALGKDLSQQPQMVLDGVADLAYVIPAMSPERFPDNAVVELPGLYRDVREATLVFSRLVASHALAGYEDFVVVGAYAADPETIHMRSPVTSLKDLDGKRIRTINLFQSAALEKLGMSPAVMRINQTAEAISSGAIDGATLSTAPMLEFGIGRVATYHYMLRTSAVPVLLVMNKSKFESMPENARSIIQKYCGQWAAERFIEIFQAQTDQVMDQIGSDPRRKVIAPSKADLRTAQAVFSAVTDEFATKHPRGAELLKAADAVVASLRSSQ